MINKKIKFYLAHSLLERKKIRRIEEQLEQELGIELINPFYDTNRMDIQKIDKGRRVPFSKKSDYKKIVEGDLKLIRGADGIIAFVGKKLSVGSMMEIFYAARILKNKKVYLVIQNKKIRYHPWLVYCADEIFTSVNELKEFLEESKYQHYRSFIFN